MFVNVLEGFKKKSWGKQTESMFSLTMWEEVGKIKSLKILREEKLVFILGLGKESSGDMFSRVSLLLVLRLLVIHLLGLHLWLIDKVLVSFRIREIDWPLSQAEKWKYSNHIDLY